MAEIKLSDSFLEEVEAFRASGEGLNTDGINTITAEGLSLPAVDAYQERLFRIWKVMIGFKVLIKKDAADMDALAARLKAADTPSE